MTSKRDKIKQNRSQLYRQNEELESESIRQEDAGKLLLWKSRGIVNIGNLIFAGVVAGGIFEDVGHPWIVLSGGIFVAAVCYLTINYIRKVSGYGEGSFTCGDFCCNPYCVYSLD